MPDHLIREIPLIQRAAQRNEAQDFRFRAYLKGELDWEDAKLDALVRQTTDSVWQQIDCTTCAHCCRTLQIEVDATDIERLAARLQMTVDTFTQRYVVVAEDIDGRWQHFAAKPCPFLGQDNRGTVYEDRPQVCRGYPYLYAEGFRSRTLAMLGRVGECPIVFNVWQSLKQQLRAGRRSR